MDINKLEFTPVDGKILIYQGDAPRILDPFDYKGFQYESTSTKSFATIVKEKGKKENAVIFVNEDGFYSILNDTVNDRPQDTVKLNFMLSANAKEWSKILYGGSIFTIKQLADFLKRREDGEIDNLSELLYAVQNFKYVSNISGDFTFDDRNNYTFCVKVNEAEGTVRIPQLIIATIEVYKDSGWPQCIEIEMEIRKPKEAGEQPLFFLSCPKWERYLESAKDNESEALQRELTGWLVVSGYPNQNKRT